MDSFNEIINLIIPFLNPNQIRNFALTCKYINRLCQYSIKSEKWINLNKFSDFINYFNQGKRYILYNNKILKVVNYTGHSENTLVSIMLSDGSIIEYYSYNYIKILSFAIHKYKLKNLKISIRSSPFFN